CLHAVQRALRLFPWSRLCARRRKGSPASRCSLCRAGSRGDCHCGLKRPPVFTVDGAGDFASTLPLESIELALREAGLPVSWTSTRGFFHDVGLSRDQAERE